MLQPLVSYARSHGLVTEPGFAPKTVRWALVCDPRGKFLEVLDLADDPKGPGLTFPRCPELSQPEIKRGSPGCRHFLVDSADVVALLADGDLDAKLLAKHAYFTRLLRQAAEALPVLASVADTLDSPEGLAEIQAGLRARKAKPTDKVTFSILGASPAYPVESDVWHDWWRRFRRTLGKEKHGKLSGKRETTVPRVRCLASGELIEPTPTHPKITGLSDIGGLPAGDVLASFKQKSFCSYGLVQSANAPVSKEIAAEYRAALNHLIKENGRRLAGTKVVPWFKNRVPRETDLFSFLLDESTEEAYALERVKTLITAIESGHYPADLLDNQYFALTLSGASGRVMVRDWMEGQFEDLAYSVKAWFDDLSIVRPDGKAISLPPKLRLLLAALVRELNEDTRKALAPLEIRLWRAAVRRQEPVPWAAMTKSLARAKVDILSNRPPNPARMGLLKAFHIRKGESMEPYLNEDHPDPAYHCGRLMAMLAALQYRALGDVGAGVVQRYYAAASTTPALVLGRLVRTAQFHLDKLDRGLARWHEGRIADVFGRIQQDIIPPTLSLERQSIFALGYYQQIAFDRPRTKAADAAEAPETSSDVQETGHE